ncbi:LL-diaminopimelate aminotransferase [Parabacteroides sp. 52]|uniref:LL-diaminopimelate aminotransferase n=1 Tax=unclassified Parabacteroides TaxID=2649774 RepID=UPI0013D776BC|nr:MULTISPECIES: LL-diaminopimelate aminotransferase [unclassified Parabacteroides]MDH6533625.1 LL-diaminopimelate aminotransferase [Parabacteroides sp. PM5-20]NDV54377.1 LL-diaminopimelate aminotransferase [Parabacteroides sp. 52]
MVLINEYFNTLSNSYLFSEIAQRVALYKSEHPEASLISLGIGDITCPLAPAVIQAMHKAVDEMADISTIYGYAPDKGYPFLIEAIIKNDFNTRGIPLDADEVFINDGAKSDTGNIGDILGMENTVAITNPVYPVYMDTNKMAGRKISYLPATHTNGFIPEIPVGKVDMIYLCYPNNPTGTTLTKEQLKTWVDYARKKKSLILFDAAYEAFITEKNIPHSIYEIEGAKEVAIEFRSFSKTAGFTGVRCGYTVVPKELKGYDRNGKMYSLNKLWSRRQSTKFNGTAYIAQRGAEAVYSPEGQKQIKETIHYYMENAHIIKKTLEELGLTVYGGVNAPYIWAKTPENVSSWHFFDKMLKEVEIITTPGVGFGENGEGFIRLTAFGQKAATLEAMDRLKKHWQTNS